MFEGDEKEKEEEGFFPLFFAVSLPLYEAPPLLLLLILLDPATNFANESNGIGFEEERGGSGEARCWGLRMVRVDSLASEDGLGFVLSKMKIKMKVSLIEKNCTEI